MNNTLAIFFNKKFILPDRFINHIQNIYKDYFYIVNSISEKQITTAAIMHYTDVRMRGIDILVYDFDDIVKVNNFHNNIILYYSKKIKNYTTLNIHETQKLIKTINKIYYDDTINKQMITDILNFTGEVEHV